MGRGGGFASPYCRLRGGQLVRRAASREGDGGGADAAGRAGLRSLHGDDPGGRKRSTSGRGSRGSSRSGTSRRATIVKEGQLLLVIDEEPFQVAARPGQGQAGRGRGGAGEGRAVPGARGRPGPARARPGAACCLRGSTRRAARACSTARPRPARSWRRPRRRARRTRPRSRPTGRTSSRREADYEINILTRRGPSIEAARTAVRTAEIDLGYCRDHAPIEGTDLRSRGRRRQPRGRRPGRRCWRHRQDRPDLRLHVRERGRPAPGPESDRRQGQPGRPAQSADPSWRWAWPRGGLPAPGRVDYTDPGVDPGTGTIRIRGVFANPAGSILPGLFVRVRGGDRDRGRTPCSCPSGPSGTTRRAITCSSWARTTSSR